MVANAVVMSWISGAESRLHIVERIQVNCRRSRTEPSKHLAYLHILEQKRIFLLVPSTST